MNEIARLALLLGSTGVAVTVLSGLAIRSKDETRRIRRGLKAILGEEPHAFLTAPGTGRGAGFNFSSNVLAVTWDSGAWGLIYRLDELAGAELIVDGVVVGRVHRGEARRAVDRLEADGQVRLRLVFDDPAHPDFDLDLWTDARPVRKGAGAADALEEANRWLARTEALLRRQTGAPLPRPTAPASAPTVAIPPAAAAPVAAAAAPVFSPLADDEDDDEEVSRELPF